MEELVLEFEVKTEDNAKFTGFLEEVQEKLNSMSAFKKTFQKFQLSVDTSLKKVVVCTLAWYAQSYTHTPACTCRYTHPFACIHVSTCIHTYKTKCAHARLHTNMQAQMHA